MIELMQKILMLQIQALTLQIQILRKKIEEMTAVYRMARSSLGYDVSPFDVVNDELGCAESVSWIFRKVVGNFPIITGTWTLNEYLKWDKRFQKVDSYQPGTIIISPTGSGNGKIRGHVGICGEGENIMSSDSNDGVWKMNYSQQTWKSRYGELGGFPIYYYQLISPLQSGAGQVRDKKMSALLKLNKSDFVKGLVAAVVVVVLGSVQQAVQAHGLDVTAYDWSKIIELAVMTAIGYLSTNLMSDDKGKVLGVIG